MKNEVLDKLVLKYQNQEISLKRLLLDIQVAKGVLTDRDVYHLFTDYNIPLKDIEHWVRITKSLEIVEHANHHMHLCHGQSCLMKINEKVQKLVEDQTTYQVHYVGCMGMCSLGPMAALDGKVYNDINYNQPFIDILSQNK